MGVEPVPLEVLDREDAERPELAAKVAGAGLVYLSGGNPGVSRQHTRRHGGLGGDLAALGAPGQPWQAARPELAR